LHYSIYGILENLTEACLIRYTAAIFAGGKSWR